MKTCQPVLSPSAESGGGDIGIGLAVISIEATIDAGLETDATQVPRRDPSLYYGYDA